MQTIRRQILGFFRRSETVAPIVLAVLVGLAAGGGAILFRKFVESAHAFFFGQGERLLGGLLGEAYVIVLPTIGLPLVAWIVRRWAPEVRGHSVPEVMYAVRKGGGRIRARVAALQALASALCIGSGGSVGREGPIVQIGGAIGSTLGQALRLPTERVKLLLACGAAGGLAGTFNAPIAGVIFAMEVILGTFGARSFGLVVVSSVTATGLCRSVLGEQPAFMLREVFSLASPLELPLYLVLGVIAGLVALAYANGVHLCEELFSRWRISPTLKAAAGGLAVGVLGYLGILWFGGPHLFGVGYEAVEGVLKADSHLLESSTLGNAVVLLVALGALKIVVTSITLGAGGSGGVFAPGLFIGCMVGSAFGLVVNAVMPTPVAHPGAYALVAMGAVFAGAAHAPMTSILVLFEMTDDYQIILPLMLAVVVSYLIAYRISPDSIYSVRLRRLGGLAPPRPEPSVLDMVLVSDAMDSDVRAVRASTPISEVADVFARAGDRALPVVDQEACLIGMVTAYDVAAALVDPDGANGPVDEITHPAEVTCTPDQHLSDVIRDIAPRDASQIPVVDTDDPRHVVGLLRQEEILWAFNEMATEHRRMFSTVEVDGRLGPEHLVQRVIEVTATQAAVAFRPLREVRLPPQCLVTVVRRGDRTIVPRGETVVEPGDTLLLFSTPRNARFLDDWIHGLGG